MADPGDYTVGWICAINTEHVAARAFLDDEHQAPSSISQHDSNAYTLGRIGEHNVVIAVLPMGEYGTNSAATVARDMLHSFPNIRIGLMVGIGGGAPSEKHDIRLGDVVVSSPGNGRGGVLQYDFGKTVQNQSFQRTGFLDQPPTVLRTNIQSLRSKYEVDGHQLHETIQDLLTRKPKLRRKYMRPDPASDQLYRSDFVHLGNSDVVCAGHCDSDFSKLINRPPRDEYEDNPAIHYGLIASANELMKDALTRDRLAKQENVLCFEMEAAGLMNHFPCLVIRGICDYADSHKSKEWQGYAAMTAASYTRDLLLRIPPTRLQSERKLSDVIDKLTYDVNDIKEHTTRTIDYLDTEKLHKILDWLTRFDHSSDHDKHLSNHHDGTGIWFLNSESHRRWLDTPGQTLFCTGIPGAGKTIMTAVLVRNLQEHFRGDSSIGIAYVYCDYKRHKEQTAQNLLASLLAQLVYVVIDALDECQTSNGCRAMFLNEMFKLQDSIDVNLFATSRPMPEVMCLFEGRDNGSSLQIHANKDDLQCYADHQMERMPGFIKEDPILRDKMKTTVVEAPTIGHMEEMLQQLPHDFYATYEQTVERINRQSENIRKLAKKVLAWVVYARRPLSSEELRHAVTIKPGSSQMDQRFIPSVQTMISVCSGLVGFNKETDEFTLAHYTVQEYLEGQAVTESWFQDSHAHVARACITYLNFAANIPEENLSENSKWDELKQEVDTNSALDLFMRYAAHNWDYHARENEEPCQDAILNLIGDHSRKVLCAMMTVRNWGCDLRTYQSWHDLHYAAFFGLYETTKILLHGAKSTRINMPDTKGGTPLFYAAGGGDERIVEKLIRSGAAVDTRDYRGHTPLLWAAQNGLEHIVDILISHEAQIEGSDGAHFWQFAAKWRSDHLCELAHQMGADIDSTNYPDERPLITVARQGNWNAVKILLENGAQINAPDSNGDTPLSHAVSHGSGSVVKLLLLNGAQLEVKNYFGYTPLSDAAQSRRLVVVETLLEHGANVNSRSIGDTTALWWAAEGGYEATVRLLLQHGADVNSRDTWGYTTPLYWAAKKGYDDISRLLLRAGAQVNLTDQEGDSALSVSVLGGHTNVVDLLLQNGADVNSRNNDGQTPLFVAVKNEKNNPYPEDIVAMLLQKGAAVNQRDTDGNTPLYHASIGNSNPTYQLLLQHGAQLEPSKASDYQRLFDTPTEPGGSATPPTFTIAPLTTSVARDDALTAELWRIQGCSDPNVQDLRGSTPLHKVSQRRSPSATLEALVQRDDVLIDSRHDSGQANLMLAGTEGFPQTLTRLINHGADAAVLQQFQALSSNELQKYTVCNGAFELEIKLEIKQEDYPRRKRRRLE
ncbi:hypothetical protein NM208_g8903 [Fusarium decemcellulare]|uniref:Uncharacterized protein n=1 Tax=Fusarium decemcellulare TaxID=57161 RepID=A0ACC1S3K2_9HYPO|nr:hypothetical protein NM208_g8903 [Fusarium decemcellulare]